MLVVINVKNSYAFVSIMCAASTKELFVVDKKEPCQVKMLRVRQITSAFLGMTDCSAFCM